jgi:hypothetical protein
MATAPTPADAKRGPYTAAFGAIHHEDAPGFLFTVAPESAAEGVADAMNRAYAAEQAAKARPTEGELAEAAERLRYQVENHTSFSSEQEADISKLLAAAEAGRDPWPAGITEVRVGPDATNANCRRVIVNGAQWCKVYGMDGASVEARAEIIADALRLSGAAAGGDRLKEALLRAAGRDIHTSDKLALEWVAQQPEALEALAAALGISFREPSELLQGAEKDGRFTASISTAHPMFANPAGAYALEKVLREIGETIRFCVNNAGEERASAELRAEDGQVIGRWRLNGGER